MPDDKFAAVGTNIAEKATMIWNVADMLRGPFKPHEYGLVILPMTVVKRFHDCLLPTHDAVLETYEKVKHFAVKDGFLTKASGYQFYNISKFTFDSLLTDPENIEANFRDYLAGFSANVQDVLSKFDFERATWGRIGSRRWTAATSSRTWCAAFPSPSARKRELTSPAGMWSIS